MPVQRSLSELQVQMAMDEELQRLMRVRVDAKQTVIDQPKKSNMFNKVLNYLCSLGMVVASVVRNFRIGGKKLQLDVHYLALSAYLMFAAVVFAAAESESKLIYKYTEILTSPFGKGLFLLFMSVILFDITRTIDSVTSICIMIVAMSNLVASLFTKTPEPIKEPE